VRGIGLAKNKKIFDVFLREKPSMMLIKLLNTSTEIYASTLAKSVDCTYSHVVKILQEMEDAGLVSFEKTGRLKILKLTKKGEDIAKHIDAVNNGL
jgi:predicted transcriptional regulator